MTKNHDLPRLRRFYRCFLFYFFISVPLFAQDLTVTGQITDGNLPISGATILVKNSAKGIISDDIGRYRIVARANDTLVYSFIGYIPQTIAIHGRNEINVQLLEDIAQLDEVTLNAGYYSVKERESTGSIEKVKQSEIEQQPLTNPLSALQGRVPGVEVTQTTGVPGGGFNIRIRGQNSIRRDGNEPLYIVDGVPYASSTLGEVQTSGSIIPGGVGISPLNALNAADIESIEILKDADATSIYGSRGANGVVLITTRKGKYGATKFEINLSSSLGSVANKLDLLNTPQYLEMRKEAFLNDGIDPIPANAYDINGTWDETWQTDWQKQLFGKTAQITNLQATISGGKQQTQFLVSANLNKQTTVFPGDFRNNKISVLSNLNHQSQNEKLKLLFSANYTNDSNNLLSGDLVGEAMFLPPNAPPLYNEDGGLNWENSTWRNPLRLLEGLYNSRGSSLIGNLSLDYSIFKGLNIKTNAGYTESHLKELRTIPSTLLDPAYGYGSEISAAIHNTAKRNSWIVEPQLHGEFAMGKTKVKTLLGLTFQDQTSSQLSQFASGYTSNALIQNIGGASSLFVSSDIPTQYRYSAFFTRINLNHDGKYILNLTGRRDGSSRFGPNNRFSNFGAVGGAWIFTEEGFIKNTLKFLSFGKLRASFGITGNDQIGDYQYLDTYSFGYATYENVIGLSPIRLFNPDYSWEKNKKLEIAVELALFKDRISINGSHYRNRSSSQLIGIPLPGTTGFNSLNANLNATVENTGWEIGFHSVNLKSETLKWTTSLYLTIPKNKLVEFPNLEGSTYANQLVVGEALNITKVYELKGVNPLTGYYEFIDFNNDGIISAIEDRQVVKDLNPDYFGGIGNTLSYKNFTLDVLFQFTKQLGTVSSGIVGGMSNQPTSVLDRWQNVGDITDTQRFTTGSDIEGLVAFYNFQDSDAAITDASYIRLKTLSLSYRLPNFGKNSIDCQLFLRGQNLLTFTKYDGLDPETRSNSTLPPLRIITIGTKITL